MKIKYGTTRATLLIGRFAIKFAYGLQWTHFLQGLINNVDERMWFRQTKHIKLCPNYYCLFGGFILICARVTVLSDLSENDPYIENFYYDEFCEGDETVGTWENLFEEKLDTFGIYKGRIVAVDYH